MSDYGELVAELRHNARSSLWPTPYECGLANRSATAIESLQAEVGRLRRLLEAERESLRLAVDENQRPW